MGGEILEEPISYSYEDFADSTAPYEYIYRYEEDKFTQSRELEKLSRIAAKVGYRAFKKTYKDYVKKLRENTGTIYSDSTTQFEGQELELNCGQWKADEFGVTIEGPYGEIQACNHPILPVMRLVNIDTNIEKLKIAYRKGKQWRSLIMDKKTLASNNSILALADFGVAVTSENSKYLVRYLHDVEHLNYDVIPEKNSVSRLGWIEGEGFSPYVDGLVFDGDLNFRLFFESVQCRGTPEKWLDMANTIRQDSVFARLILASSFASVMVKPLGGLPFFVHLWGGTEVGKTVGLMLAASVWACPELGKFIHTFNSTVVGREKSAAFVNSLPLILDELQIVKERKEFDKDIYMLAEGAGRTRGNKNGGVDKTPTWSNCILTSGEMPITSARSGGGAVNRIIEIECKQKLFSNPQQVAETVKRNYGFAGKTFVSLLMASENLQKANQFYQDYYNQLISRDTTEKQAMAAALVLTADVLATEWIFQDNRALTIEEIGDFLQSKTAVSLNERAYHYLCEYIAQNRNKFTGESDEHDVWGKIDGNTAFVVNREFCRVCEDAGFSAQSFKSWLKQNGKSLCDTKRTTKKARINGVPIDCVALMIGDESEDDYGLLD